MSQVYLLTRARGYICRLNVPPIDYLPTNVLYVGAILLFDKSTIDDCFNEIPTHLLNLLAILNINHANIRSP